MIKIASGRAWDTNTKYWDSQCLKWLDLSFDLSRSLKVKCKGAIWQITYGFLLVNNGNLVPISNGFGVMSHQMSKNPILDPTIHYRPITEQQIAGSLKPELMS